MINDIDISELPKSVELSITISPDDYKTLCCVSGVYDSGIVGHIINLYQDKANINKNHKRKTSMSKLDQAFDDCH